MSHLIVSDESGTSDHVQSVAFIAGPIEAIKALNRACKTALANVATSEIKFKDIDDHRRKIAAIESLGKFLDCHESRLLVLTWDTMDSRHQIKRRDDNANFHRMLFHGLRSVADWFGDVEWNWHHDQLSSLDQGEITQFLNNTRGHRSLEGMEYDLFGKPRHHIRIANYRQEDSKKVPLIGLADFFAGVVRHSIVDSGGCLEHHRSRSGQSGFDELEVSSLESNRRTILAKREMVSHFRDECSKRKLGVSLESSKRLQTHKRGDKIWIWHYEPQTENDKAPTKPQRTLRSQGGFPPGAALHRAEFLSLVGCRLLWLHP